MEEELLQAADDRKMIPVTPETHARVMRVAGRLTTAQGRRVPMEAVIVAALDMAETAIVDAAYTKAWRTNG